MNASKIRATLHLLAQFLGQGVVFEFVPPHFKPLFSLLVGLVGVFVAYLDQTASQS